VFIERSSSRLDVLYTDTLPYSESNSLNIEPNGDIYTCQEMADVGAGKLGNAISGERQLPYQYCPYQKQ
jgi:radical SAM protein with 4Fe4S-binding SPASM domain